MATNKNAILRYQILDRCFSNFGRKYTFDDLMEEVNNGLAEYNPNTAGVQVRQLRDDIKFMRSEAGYDAPIETFPDGRKPYYRYIDKTFSINNSPLNTNEAEQLKNALSVLNRFDGAPGFEWLSELSSMLQSEFNLSGDNKAVMAFESNIDYSGYKWITPLFNAITNKRVLKVIYKPFTMDPFEITFHPYFLKQYNNRWFVFGYNEEREHVQWNLSLDRIVSTEEIGETYKDDVTDWDDFLYDLIGVTRPDDAKVEDIVLKFSAKQAPYIETKPIHASQKSYLQIDGTLDVKLKLIINYELISLILSFGNAVNVISPNHLKKEVEDRK